MFNCVRFSKKITDETFEKVRLDTLMSQSLEQGLSKRGIKNGVFVCDQDIADLADQNRRK